MSASASVTVPVSTKTDDGSSSAASNPNVRRNSSSNSLDVAATIFSSMQELEASGRNLASLGLSALGGRPELGLEAGRNGGMGPPAPLGAGGLSGEAAALARLGALRSFPASRTNSSDSLAAMEKMLAATSAAGGGGYAGSIHAQADALRRLEMEEALLQQQGLSHRAALYGTLPGPYAPMGARRSPGGLDDFSPEELLREVERRQGQRRASREFATGMPGILSRDNSRDDLAALYKAEMYGQFRRGTTGGSSGGAAPGARRNSLDSLSSLALLANSAKNAAEQQQKEAANANANAATEAAGNDASNDDGGGKDANDQKKKGEDVVVMVPTSKPESKKVGKKAAKDSGTNSTVVTDTPSPQPPAKDKAVPTDNTNTADKLSGQKRNTSTASFDALLSVLGDDMSRQGVARTAGGDDDASAGSANYFHHLVERTAHAAAAARQREEEDQFLATAAALKRQRRASTESSLSDGLTPLGHRKPTLDVGALTGGAGGGSQDMLLAHMDALRQKSRGGMGGMSGMGGIPGLPGLPPLDAPGFPGRPIGTAEYQRRFRDHADMMASLEALRRDEYLTKQRALREGRLRELQAQEARLGRLPLGAYPPGEMARLSALMGTHLAGGYGGPTPHHAMAAESMLARLQGLPVQNGGGRAGKRRAPKPKADPHRVRPDLALEQFLSRFDEKGKEARERLLGAIKDTEGSLATIHAWDRSRGLRKCHSRTVVKTRRSRGRLKAFLMGVDPPKEPVKKKKKKRGRRFVEYYDDDDY